MCFTPITVAFVFFPCTDTYLSMIESSSAYTDASKNSVEIAIAIIKP